MQRQKTIAKWLAVLLLLTIAVASYFVLSSVLNKGGAHDNVAGAQDGGVTDVPPSDEGGEAPPALDQDPPHVPIYSEFPRLATDFDSIRALNIGGEGDETPLDYIYFGGKHLLFFASSSTEHDVKEQGLHVAVIDGDILVSVHFIANGEDYIDCTQSDGKLLLVTKDSLQTVLRILDTDLKATYKRTLPLYSDLALFSSGGYMRLYASDSNGVHVYTVSTMLSVSKSSRIAPLPDSKIVCIMPSGASDLLFLQTENGILTYTYSTNTGFISQDELLNCRFEQILPVSADGENTFALLASCDEGYVLWGIDQSGEHFKMQSFSGARAAALYKSEDKIVLLSDGFKHTFCAHLDSMLSAPVVFPTMSEGDFSLRATARGDLYAVFADAFYTLFESDGKIEVERSLKADVAPLTIYGSDCKAYFYASRKSDFDALSFGGSDIYFVIDTQK